MSYAANPALCPTVEDNEDNVRRWVVHESGKVLAMRKRHQVLTRISYAQTGLSGKRARVLVDQPTDEIDFPADLPPGTQTVVIVDDAPNPHHTLRVYSPKDPSKVALVVYDQLALEEIED